MNNKSILITGATGDIGREISFNLAEEGYIIIVNYPMSSLKEEAEALIKELNQRFPNDHYAVEADVTSEKDVIELFSVICGKEHQLYGVINNAGITKDKLLMRMSLEDFEQVINVNLTGAFIVCKHAIKTLAKHRDGVIINLSSVVGLAGNAGQINYSSSKAGLLGLTKSLALEYASRNIRVNAIAPGFIKTKMSAKIPENIVSKIIDAIPLKKYGTPKDVAGVANFLVSDKANYITGTTIVVDGGLTRK